MFFDTAECSEIGGRRINEDSLFCSHSGDKLAALVADGLGGEGGGDIASSLAVQKLRESLPGLFPLSEKTAAAFFKDANDAILASQTHGRGMKTTAALLLADGGDVLCAHRGDSRIYQFRSGSIIYQSIDHSVSQAAVLVGEITPEELRSHPDRSVLMGCLGIRVFRPPTIYAGSIQPGDAFLLCSDGFWEYVLEGEMTALLLSCRSAGQWLDAMLKTAAEKAPVGRDNFSAITIICNNIR